MKSLSLFCFWSRSYPNYFSFQLKNGLNPVLKAGYSEIFKLFICQNFENTKKVPTSPLGKFVGSLCCMTGIFVIALPIPIIVGNFTECYKEKKSRHRNFRRKSLNPVKK